MLEEFTVILRFVLFLMDHWECSSIYLLLFAHYTHCTMIFHYAACTTWELKKEKKNISYGSPYREELLYCEMNRSCVHFFDVVLNTHSRLILSILTIFSFLKVYFFLFLNLSNELDVRDVLKRILCGMKLKDFWRIELK